MVCETIRRQKRPNNVPVRTISPGSSAINELRYETNSGIWKKRIHRQEIIKWSWKKFRYKSFRWFRKSHVFSVILTLNIMSEEFPHCLISPFLISLISNECFQFREIEFSFIMPRLVKQTHWCCLTAQDSSRLLNLDTKGKTFAEL